MKFLPVSLALCCAILPLSAQEEITPEWDVEIPGPIADGAQAEPAQELKSINFKVQTSRIQRVKATEAAEMPDLPPVKGTINFTVQMVEDPGLPDPPAPLPVLQPDDPAVVSRMDELREKYHGTDLLLLSATVYDHSRTFLRIYPNGKAEGEISAWTNIDFNHFSGWSTYRVKDSDGTFHDCGLLMGIGNTDTKQLKSRAVPTERYEGGPIPKLPDVANGPAFVVVKGDTDSAAMDSLEQVHELYRKEGARMKLAFSAREKARAERKAFLLAHPPAPRDVSIQFWKRDQSPAPENNVTPGAR